MYPSRPPNRGRDSAVAMATTAGSMVLRDCAPMGSIAVPPSDAGARRSTTAPDGVAVRLAASVSSPVCRYHHAPPQSAERATMHPVQSRLFRRSSAESVEWNGGSFMDDLVRTLPSSNGILPNRHFAGLSAGSVSPEHARFDHEKPRSLQKPNQDERFHTRPGC